MEKVDLKRRTLISFQQLNAKLQKQAIFLALSGGRDSIALANVLINLRSKLPKIYFLHVNYGVRVPDCDREEIFLREWAGQNDISIFIKKVKKSSKKKNFQHWARVERYAFFAETIFKTEPGLLWTAHHQDDQVETLLQKLIMGGEFQGMRALQDFDQFQDLHFKRSLTIFRPWLNISRRIIDEYVKGHQLIYFEDSSNAKLDYQRNRIRHQILPLLNKENPRFNSNLCLNFNKIHELKHASEDYVTKWLKRNLKNSSNAWKFSTSHLKKLKKAFQRQVIFEIFAKQFPLYRNQGKVIEKILEAINNNPVVEQSFKLKGGTVLELNKDFCCLKSSK